MRIPESLIEEISRRTDIVELIGSYVSLKPSGSRFMGLCPFHSEKTPSFSVSPDVGAFYCFGCNRGGSAFNFVMELEGLSFPESVKFLAERAGVEFESEEDDGSSRRRKGLLELYSRVSKSFAHFLTDNPKGEAALKILSDRGVSEEAIATFGLGYSPSDPFWLHGFLENKGYSGEFLAASGLFTRANDRRSLFAGRIMFPIVSRRGEVVGFGGRLIEGDGPKYINSPETEVFHKSSTLYGMNLAARSIRRERQVVVAEGYMDVIALHQAGIENAVAPLGTALTEQHVDAVSRNVESAVLVFDGDEAGARATSKASRLFESHGIRPEVVLLEPGSDPADMLKTGGSQAITDAISSPLTALEFLVRTGLTATSDGGDSNMSPRGKSFVLDEVFPYISVMRSEVRRRESLRLAADMVGVDREAVIRDYGRYHRGAGRDLRPAPPAHETSGTHDLYLMLAASSSREFFPYVRQWVQSSDLDDTAAREIYLALEESFRREETSLEALLTRIEDESVRDLVRRRLAAGEFDGVDERAIRDSVISVRRRSLERKVRDVESRLRRLASGADNTLDEVELLSEKIYLDKELQKLKGDS